MSFILILIRHDIENGINTTIIGQVLSVLENKKNTDKNQIRKAVLAIPNIDSVKWNFTHRFKETAKYDIIEDESVYDLLIKLFNELNCLLKNKEFGRAYDLADCFHCLPDIIADNDITVPDSFWENRMTAYRNKWDKTFLIDEETLLKENKNETAPALEAKPTSEEGIIYTNNRTSKWKIIEIVAFISYIICFTLVILIHTVIPMDPIKRNFADCFLALFGVIFASIMNYAYKKRKQ